MDRESKWEENRAFLRSSVSQLEKLKPLRNPGIHFLAWKCRVKLILECAKLWDVVDPDQKVDSSGVSPDGVSNEERKREARGLLQSAVAFDIRGNDDPRECWIYLQNRFAPNTPARRVEFKRRLYNLRMEEGEKVEEFFNRVDQCLWHLRDMGVVVDEKELVSILILALPLSWDVSAMTFWQETDTLTKDDMFGRMRNVESMNELRAQMRRR